MGNGGGLTESIEPVLDIAAAAEARVSEIEGMLHHQFNTHTSIRTLRSLFRGLGISLLPGMEARRQTPGDAESVGATTARSIILSTSLMGDNGPLYLARIAELLLPVAKERIRMRDTTRAWEAELRLAKKEGRPPPDKAMWMRERLSTSGPEL